MTSLYLPLERPSRVPIHRQIYDGLRRAIHVGLLRPGQRVPSTRALAADLRVSRIPALMAYERLLQEGYLETRTGSGTFVSATPPHDLLDAARRRVPGVARAGAQPQRAQGETSLAPFRISLPALDQFPHAAWAALVARQARALRHSDMAYGDPAGLPSLRSAIAEHLRAARAVRCEAEQVLIVSGSQEALRLAAAVLLRPGDRIAVEEPGYPLARAALSAGGAVPVPVRVDASGLSVAALRGCGARVRAAHVTPSHQYPLGTTMDLERRRALLDWAGGNGAWILEDDYDSEYRYAGRPVASLQGMDRHARVVYIGTFSKALFPAVRVGYVVVPRPLWHRFMEVRECFDLLSPTLYQAALAVFLRDGHLARHLHRMRAVYLRRREALLAGLQRDCGEWLAVCDADAGLHVAALLAPGLDDVDVVRRLAARGLTATPLSTCYVGEVRQHGLLLGFGGSTEQRLLGATPVLAEALGEAACASPCTGLARISRTG